MAVGSGTPDVPGVMALPPLIVLSLLAAAGVLEAISPLPVSGTHALAGYVGGTMLAAGGFFMIAIGTRRFAAVGTNVPPTLPTIAPVPDGIYRRTRSAWESPSFTRARHGGGTLAGDRAGATAAVGDQRRRRSPGGALSERMSGDVYRADKRRVRWWI